MFEVGDAIEVGRQGRYSGGPVSRDEENRAGIGVRLGQTRKSVFCTCTLLYAGNTDAVPITLA